jgi:hypothetical protein
VVAPAGVRRAEPEPGGHGREADDQPEREQPDHQRRVGGEDLERADRAPDARQREEGRQRPADSRVRELGGPGRGREAAGRPDQEDPGVRELLGGDCLRVVRHSVMLTYNFSS